MHARYKFSNWSELELSRGCFNSPSLSACPRLKTTTLTARTSDAMLQLNEEAARFLGDAVVDIVTWQHRIAHWLSRDSVPADHAPGSLEHLAAVWRCDKIARGQRRWRWRRGRATQTSASLSENIWYRLMSTASRLRDSVGTSENKCRRFWGYGVLFDHCRSNSSVTSVWVLRLDWYNVIFALHGNLLYMKCIVQENVCNCSKNVKSHVFETKKKRNKTCILDST